MEEWSPGLPRRKGFQADGVGAGSVNCGQNVQQDEDREVTMGLNTSELFGVESNANLTQW